MKPSQTEQFIHLTYQIALGLQDLDLVDFQKRMNLSDGWDWNDVGHLLDDGALTFDDLTHIIADGLN